MRDFKKHIIQRQSMGKVRGTYETIDSLPYSERYGVWSQRDRDSVSIAPNLNLETWIWNFQI